MNVSESYSATYLCRLCGCAERMTVEGSAFLDGATEREIDAEAERRVRERGWRSVGVVNGGQMVERWLCGPCGKATLDAFTVSIVANTPQLPR